MHLMLDAIAVIGLAICLTMLAWHIKNHVIAERRMTPFHRWMSGVSREPSYLKSPDEF